ncbi:collagen alpha-1(XXVIII) chain [Apus apus]|uniref:collagen alpha-1(XXVIII) chain n=1 Tax=Apus apus TaxID=8895 RepID=UPI0021F8C0E8|nr:collagen alpha-1(XXVIII) chain [Apus apus]
MLINLDECWKKHSSDHLTMSFWNRLFTSLDLNMHNGTSRTSHPPRPNRPKRHGRCWTKGRLWNSLSWASRTKGKQNSWSQGCHGTARLAWSTWLPWRQHTRKQVFLKLNMIISLDQEDCSALQLQVIKPPGEKGNQGLPGVKGSIGIGLPGPKVISHKMSEMVILLGCGIKRTVTPLELVFVIDSSESVRPDNFNIIKTFLKAVIHKVSANHTRTCIGIINFSH